MKALGDQNRFRIVMMLMKRPLCVCELLEVLDIAGGTMSNHLKVLKNAGLISQKKSGKWIEYTISDKSSRDLIDYISAFIVDKSVIEEDRTQIESLDKNFCSGSGKQSLKDQE